MDYKFSRLVAVGSLAGVIALGAGCSNGSSPSTPGQQQVAQSNARSTNGVVDMRAASAADLDLEALRPDIFSVDACQKSTKETIKAAGGAFTLPACASLKGKVTYAKNNAPSGSSTTLESYATNPGGVPTPSKGKVLVYVSSLGSSTVTFSGKTSKISTISGAPIITGHDYQLYAYALGFLAPGFPVDLGMPKTAGKITFATPLQNGEQVPGSITVYFELVQN